MCHIFSSADSKKKGNFVCLTMYNTAFALFINLEKQKFAYCFFLNGKRKEFAPLFTFACTEGNKRNRSLL